MQRINHNNIEFDLLTDHEVLFFIRNNGKQSYFDAYYPVSFLDKFSKLDEFRTISEYKKDADVYIDLRKFHYADICETDKKTILENINIDEIIKRCRALRAIAYSEAKSLIYSCSMFFLDLYRRSNLKLIVSGAVDNYVMDIMARFAYYFNIKVIGITDFFLYPEYKLVTIYGEFNMFREPSEEEVEKIYNKLINKSKSPLAISKFKSVKKAIREFVSYYYRYFIRYVILYKFLGFIEYEYRFAPFFKGFNSFSQLFVNKYFDKLDIENIRRNKDKYVYIPLHYYPEATIDYWTDTPEKSDYLHGVLDVINYLKEINKIAVLKEHPAFYLSRDVDFYKQIKKFNNAILIDPFISTQSLLDEIDQLIVWNGSTGIEALILDKKIGIVTESYYSGGQLNNYKDIEYSKPISLQDKKNLIRNILRTSIKVN
jgi:hypothetical protein